jgi:hypothetical protein
MMFLHESCIVEVAVVPCCRAQEEDASIKYKH